MSNTLDATLSRTSPVAPGFGSDLDVLGNLRPDANGNWNTQIEVRGSENDWVILTGTLDFPLVATTPAAVVVENRFIYQNMVLVQPTVPTLTNVGFGTAPNVMQFPLVQIPASGVFTYNVTLGAQNAFDEYPDEEAQFLQDAIGMRYPEAAPLGFNGAFYYMKLGINF